MPILTWWLLFTISRFLASLKGKGLEEEHWRAFIMIEHWQSGRWLLWVPNDIPILTGCLKTTMLTSSGVKWYYSQVDCWNYFCWKRLEEEFQKSYLKPRVFLRIAGLLDIWEHLGKACNKLNPSCTAVGNFIIHSTHMWHFCLHFGKLKHSLCNELHSSYL